MTDPDLKVYRKRKPVRFLLRFLGILLAVLVVLSVYLFFGLRRYVAYSDTGKLYLDIPWLAGYMAGEPADDPLSAELTITGGSGQAQPLPAETAEQDGAAGTEEAAEEYDPEAEAPAPDGQSGPTAGNEVPEG